MSEIKTILEDPRPIQGIYFRLEGDPCYQASSEYVIVAYPEPGQGANVPWFAILKNGIILARVPAHMVEVVYHVRGELEP